MRCCVLSWCSSVLWKSTCITQSIGWCFKVKFVLMNLGWHFFGHTTKIKEMKSTFHLKIPKISLEILLRFSSPSAYQQLPSTCHPPDDPWRRLWRQPLWGEPEPAACPDAHTATVSGSHPGPRRLHADPQRSRPVRIHLQPLREAPAVCLLSPDTHTHTKGGGGGCPHLVQHKTFCRLSL